MKHPTKLISQIITKCVNCKFYQPNNSYNSLGLCLINKNKNNYKYNNHFNYAEIMRSKHGQCGEEGKLFKPIDKK
jgi:hypothetical protein